MSERSLRISCGVYYSLIHSSGLQSDHNASGETYLHGVVKSRRGTGNNVVRVVNITYRS